MVDQSDKQSIDLGMKSMPGYIEKKAEEVIVALKAYRKAELALEKEIARIMQVEKAKVLAKVDAQLEIIIKKPKGEAQQRMKALKMHMPTIEDLKAIATQQTYEDALGVITKESDWRSKTKEFQRAEHDFDALKERSWNYRRELKALGG